MLDNAISAKISCTGLFNDAILWEAFYYCWCEFEHGVSFTDMKRLIMGNTLNNRQVQGSTRSLYYPLL